jgi:four helix bundle protein
MVIQSYRDLEAWQLGMEFVVRVYSVTQCFPSEEKYALTSQLRKAAVSIPSNVSEGHQQGTKAYHHFVVMALGSLAESETQLEIARRLQMCPEGDLKPVADFAAQLGRVLHGLRRSLAERLESGP